MNKPSPKRSFKVVRAVANNGSLPSEPGYSKWRSTVWKEGIHGTCLSCASSHRLTMLLGIPGVEPGEPLKVWYRYQDGDKARRENWVLTEGTFCQITPITDPGEGQYLGVIPNDDFKFFKKV